MECDYGGGHFLEFRPLTVCAVRVDFGQFYSIKKTSIVYKTHAKYNCGCFF